MIIDVKKYLFVGAKEDLDQFFARAQQKGILEFISLSGKKSVEYPHEVQNLIAALKILRKQPVKEPYVGGGNLTFASETAEHVLSLKASVEKLLEEKRLLEAEKTRVAPFGDFSKEEIDDIEREGHRKIQFFCMKTAKSHKTNFSDEVFYVGTDYDLDYFITINKEQVSYPDMIEMRIDRPLGEIIERLKFVDESIHDMEAEIKDAAKYIDFLHEALLEQLDHHHLAKVKKEVSYPIDKALFAIEAWVPKTKVGAIFSVLDGLAVHCEQIAVEESDTMPTYMENKGLGRIGEDLVLIYDVPATTDKDPSLWILIAFALFGAIIVSDAGYGLLYLGAAAFIKYKFRRLKGLTKRLFNLFVFMSIAIVIWGVATSSYFGLQITPQSPLAKVSFIDYLAKKKAEYHMHAKDDVYQYWVHEFPQLEQAQTGKEFLEGAAVLKDNKCRYEMLDVFSDNILLEIALIIGIVHICLACLRNLWRNWAGVGWIIFMIGAYLYLPVMLKATSIFQFLGVVDKHVWPEVGLQMIYIGIGLAVVLALIQRRLSGLSEIANLIQVFGDVLSYLRLYALALASSIMAATFNEIGSMVGLFLGAIVILAGHCINIMLGSMAIVIHGLRLNFIEWYHFCFVGGGKLFHPLKRLKGK